MKTVAETLTRRASQLADDGLCTGVVELSDAELLEALAAAQQLVRQVDAVRVAVVGQITERSRPSLGAEGLACRSGFTTAAKLVEQVTGSTRATARSLVKLAVQVHGGVNLTGQRMPAAFEQVADAVLSGHLGVDAASAVTSGLAPILDRVPADQIRAAEIELVAAGTGSSPGSSIPLAADPLLIVAKTWCSYLDPDGVEPREEVGMRKRGIWFGKERDGTVPLKGELVPETATRMRALFDAYLTPTTAPAFMNEEELATHNTVKDPRSPAQQRHDVLVGIVDTIARSSTTPKIGGASPTVLVSVRAEDLQSGHGVGYADGTDTPFSMRTVTQMVCAGGTQKIAIDQIGKITALGSPERVFTPHQRKAITVRDGGCIIPGCDIPASWCEIHHVTEHHDGGPTHIHNGVLLCWFHHRTIHTNGWQIRMNDGTPLVKAPPWLNPTETWIPATKARTALTRKHDGARDRKSPGQFADE